MRRFLTVLFCIAALSASAAAGRRTTFEKSADLSGMKRVEVALKIDLGRCTISPAASADNDLVRLSGRYNERIIEPEWEFDPTESRGKLRFTADARRKLQTEIDSDDNTWDLTFPPDKPLNLEIEMGAAEADLDFGGLTVEAMDLDLGLVDAVVDFSEPNRTTMSDLIVDAGASSLKMRHLGNARFELLKFDGGMGSFALDFAGLSDGDAEAQIEVGMGSVEIILPAEIGVRLEADEHWFNSIEFPKRRFDRVRGRDDVWESENWSDAKARLTLILNVGMGSAELKFR